MEILYNNHLLFAKKYTEYYKVHYVPYPQSI